MSIPVSNKNTSELMLIDNSLKKITVFRDFDWKIECIKCKSEIYSLKKIRADNILFGHTTVFIDGNYKYVAPRNYENMGIYDNIDVCWTCFNCC